MVKILDELKTPGDYEVVFVTTNKERAIEEYKRYKAHGKDVYLVHSPYYSHKEYLIF